MSATTITPQKLYDRVFQSGVLMQVNVSRWGMCAQLEASDLAQNLKEEKTLPAELFTLGRKQLIPSAQRQKFDRLESRARRILKAGSFSFPIAQAHFVPATKIVAVLAELEVCRQDFTKLMEEFLAGYEITKAAMLEKYPEYAAVMEPFYPTLEALRPKFSFQITQFSIAFPSEMKEVGVEEVVRELAVRDELKETYRRSMQEQYQQALTGMNTFVDEAVQALRGEAAKVCSHVADKLADDRPLVKANLTSITDMISNFEAMNFFDDQVVVGELTKLRALVTSDADFQVDLDAIADLRGALRRVAATATNPLDTVTVREEYFRRIIV